MYFCAGQHQIQVIFDTHGALIPVGPTVILQQQGSLTVAGACGIYCARTVPSQIHARVISKRAHLPDSVRLAPPASTWLETTQLASAHPETNATAVVSSTQSFTDYM